MRSTPRPAFSAWPPALAKRPTPTPWPCSIARRSFTNVAVTDDNQPWWEGLDDRAPARDWRGRDYDPKTRPGRASEFAFYRIHQALPQLFRSGREPGRCADRCHCLRRAPCQPGAAGAWKTRDWRHGVLVGGAMASETTAAATGQVGIVRRDPMAMKPFCGYHFGDYWAHWLAVGEKLTRPPKIFQVNWFRRDADGNFIWPGFGDNLRVLEWMLARSARSGRPMKRRLACCPNPMINLDGLADRTRHGPPCWRRSGRLARRTGRDRVNFWGIWPARS
jgi:phosphoenolpyruvate carboxykinase (GTP)